MVFQSSALEMSPNWEAKWPVHRMLPAVRRRARLVLLSSGQARDMTEDRSDAVLLRRVANAMAPLGVESLNPRLPLRVDGLSDSDEALISLRSYMAARALAQDPTCRTVVLAVSLGAQSAVELTVRRETAGLIDALVLVGGIFERPKAPVGRIGSIDLVYGGRDHVGYLRDGEKAVQDIEGPNDYGPRSQKQLVTGPGVQTALYVLPGLGHALEQSTDAATNHSAALDYLVPLLRDRLGLEPKT